MNLAYLYTDPVPVPGAAAPNSKSLKVMGRRGKLPVLLNQPMGDGPHPTVLICHGYPGFEQHLDLAQALRRVGFCVATFHYSGSWGADGDFSFANCLEDAITVLHTLADLGPAYRIDPERMYIVGHSMGGFVAAQMLAKDPLLAGGVLLLVTRPFRDDDYIAACGYEGTVEDIFICNTKIRTIDNKVVYIPNGKLSTSEVVNFTEKDTRRVDLTFSVAYSADFEKAKAIIHGVCDADPLVLKTPQPNIRVSNHSASSIDLVTQAWCRNADYWTVRYNLLENVKTAFDENGIEIPFEQLDVHLKPAD